MKNYILKDGNHEPAELLEWAQWFETADRKVDLTDTPHGRVSTVFLGIDHRLGGNGPPVLYETMVFGGPYDADGERYTTVENAREGHARWVKKLNAVGSN